ncbi:Multidrug resistance-associated protein 1 [Coemansia sp. RSA 922]|nr:Multidrug resistance-associated protein 1 [Coemansia sp. S16]KAJ2113641.1 Multidrug resistance-associated protein 1 [Coemansia sp. RSA 922]
MALTSFLVMVSEGTKHVFVPMASSFLSQLVLEMTTKDNTFTPHRFSDPVSQCVAAMLVVVAAATSSGWWEQVLSVMAALTLPLLAMHSSAYTAFQCLNALGIYRALNSSIDAWITGACVLMHIYLVLANLDLRSQKLLNTVVQKVTYRQERRLVALRRLRELTLDDVWLLPERFSLRNAYNEFTYNTEEPLFLIRAILRMAWRPMIPIYIADSLLKTVSLLTTTLNSSVLHCLDSPATSAWYKGYVTVLLLFLVKAIEMQKDVVSKYSSAETSRVSDAVKLELLRLPLTKSGRRPRGSSYRNGHYVTTVIGDLQNTLGIFSSLFGTAATVWVIFRRVGFLAFMPMTISIVFSLVETAMIRFVGHRYHWEEESDVYTYDAKVDEVCLGIKTIKLFGWERMYLDPKLQQDNSPKKKLPWYAPVMRATWFVFDSLQTLTSEMSSFLTIYLHLQTASGAANPITNAELFELSSHGDNMQSSISGIFYKLQRFRTLFKCNRTLECALRGDYINALPQKDVETSAGASIRMDACSFKWRKKRLTLRDVSFSADAGELVAVVGKTAGGKSSLLLAMCSEMEMAQGGGQVCGTVSYLEQTPWIASSTLRDNILFGREFDEDHYWRVIYACALMEDLDAWPDRDLTVIGERGINLSGGQRARLALARTVYSRADIYIFDDPLSAVDAVVKRHILDNVILSSGMLGDKLRIVATHAEAILPFCNQVVTVDSGNVSVVTQVPREYNKSVVPDSPSCESDKSSVTAVNDDSEPSLTPTEDSDYDSDADSDKGRSRDDGDRPARKWSNRENAVYILRMCGLPVLASMLFSGIFSPVSSFILDGLKLDALRANSQSGSASTGAVISYLKVHFLSRIVGTIVCRVEMYIKDTIDQRYLNDEIKISFVESLIHAPLSFFDSTSRHQISTAYNEGADVVSGGVPRFLMSEFSTALQTGLSIYRVARTAPQLLVISPLIAWAVVKRDGFVDPATRSLEKIARASRVRRNRASDLITGAERMIRLYGVEAHFTDLHIEGKDEEARLQQPSSALYTLGGHMHRLIDDAGDMLMTFSMLLQSQTTIYRVTSGDLITCKQLMNTLISNIGDIVNLPSRVLQFADNIDLYRHYTDLPPEAPYIIDECRPEPEWPREGAIQMRNYTMRYAEGLKPALNNINLEIRPGEKIGIVGRTGAGKSTLAKALFRLANGPDGQGSIVIDGQDIEEIGVGDLRPRLGIIPQESTMFSGTVRQNLDPMQEFTVEDMWASMIKCDISKIVAPKRKTPENPDDDSDDEDDIYDDEQLEIKERWAKSGWLMRLVLMALDEMPDTDEYDYCPSTGLNRYIYNDDYRFSNGQQQLFSLCRLLMRRRQIIVLDEATADVDLETDRSIQELIRKEFCDCTVLTIAHRLDTVKNSDRIIVMDKGEIAEIGTPKELMEKDGLFALLVKTNDFGD